jgi:hypothetical protein
MERRHVHGFNKIFNAAVFSGPGLCQDKLIEMVLLEEIGGKMLGHRLHFQGSESCRVCRYVWPRQRDKRVLEHCMHMWIPYLLCEQIVLGELWEWTGTLPCDCATTFIHHVIASNLHEMSLNPITFLSAPLRTDMSTLPLTPRALTINIKYWCKESLHQIGTRTLLAPHDHS